MDVRQHWLAFKAMFLEAFFEIGRCFIIESMHFWLVASAHEFFMNADPTTFDLGTSFVLETRMQNYVAVMVADNQETFISL
jgi:hypothetical protein